MKAYLKTPLALLLMCICVMADAQVSLSGKLTDKANHGIDCAIVKLVEQHKMLAYTFTEKNGEYTLAVPKTDRDSIELVFTHISYHDVRLRVATKDLARRIDVVMENKNFMLREVKVKANPLFENGDTISMVLASFLNKGDFTLEDGIKRLPGVDVAESGQISFMGKPISSFNIEGLNMLGGKYNLATRNIPATYVTRVEVIRNYHEKKIDKDKPSEAVAMNIRLSNKAKFKPFGTEEAGIGYMDDDNNQLQYLAGVTGMLFNSTFQTICSLKGGNYGNYAIEDMTDHFGRYGISTNATRLLGGFGGGGSPHGKYLYQNNGIATANAVVKLDSFSTVRANVDYTYHDQKHYYGSTSTYYDGQASPVTVKEQYKPFSRSHNVKGRVIYNLNSDSLWMEERLNVKCSFEDKENDVLYMGNMIGQDYDATSFDMTNNFGFDIKRSRTRFGAWSNISFVRTPTLVIDYSNAGNEYSQSARSTTFASHHGTHFTLRITKHFHIDLPVSLRADYNNIFTFNSLKGADAGYRLTGWTLVPDANPNVWFNFFRHRLNIYLGCPLSVQINNYSNDISYCKAFVKPNARITVKPNYNNEFNINAGMGNNTGDILDLMTAPLRTDYRTERVASGIIAESKQYGGSMNWKTQMMLQYLTISAGASHYVNELNTLHSQNVTADELSSSTLAHNSRSKSTSVNGCVTKSVPALFMKLKAEGSYSWNSGQHASGKDIVDVHGRSFSVHGKATFMPVKWLELDYDYNLSKSISEYVDNSNHFRSHSHRGSLRLYPFDGFEVSSSYDYANRQIAADSYKDMTFLNAWARYKTKKIVLTFEMTNLLNQRHYSYTINDGFNIYSYDFRLCGRSCMFRATVNL